MKLKLIPLLLLLPIISIAQYRIQGRVIDSDTKSSLEGISVFLSNTIKGTVTNNKGEFQLDNLKAGKYELVITSLNYEGYIISVEVNQAIEPLVVNLKPTVNILKEVVVESYDQNGWDKWGDSFKSYFVGSSQLAKNCILTNPEVVKFKYSSNSNKLRAFSNEKLVFKNISLGYKIIYLLTKFEIDFNTNTFSFKGYPLFEELRPKGAKQAAQWNQMRNETYRGSLRHFIRSLYFNQLSNDGFEIRKTKFITSEEVFRVKNILKQIHEKGDKEVTDSLKIGRDSMDYYFKVKNLSFNENKVILNTIIPRDSIVTNLDDPNSKKVYFNDYLQVLFLNKRVPHEFAKTLPAYRSNEFTRSEISLRFNNAIYMYPNGNYYSGLDLLIDGYWAWSEKVSTMLPDDFTIKK
jgi:hypothetical protein